jgi:hypothetical protein
MMPGVSPRRRLQPDGSRLLDDIWQATFSPHGGCKPGVTDRAHAVARAFRSGFVS